MPARMLCLNNGDCFFKKTKTKTKCGTEHNPSAKGRHDAAAVGARIIPTGPPPPGVLAGVTLHLPNTMDGPASTGL
jgi:hypothetical protein